MRAFLILAVATAAPAGALARPVSLTAARAAAASLAPEIQLAERRADVSRAEVQVAGTLANPTLTVLTARLTARLGLTLSLPLQLFGQRAIAIEAARGDVVAATAETYLARQEARLAATLAWLELWETQQRALLAQVALTDAERLLTAARERFEAGSAPRLDLVRSTADRARAAADRGATTALVAAAAARLSPLIGDEPDSAIEAVGEPALRTSPDLAALLSWAADHPLLRRDLAQALAAEAHLRAERRQRWPVVNGQVTVNELDPTQLGMDVIGGASFELPSLNLRGGPIARARAVRQVADAAFVADARRIGADLRDAARRTDAAAARAGALRKEVLPAMEEARAMTEDSYRAGRADLLRLLEAQRALLEARLAQLDAKVAWARALADLERAAGRPLDGGGPDAP